MFGFRSHGGVGAQGQDVLKVFLRPPKGEVCYHPLAQGALMCVEDFPDSLEADWREKGEEGVARVGSAPQFLASLDPGQ